MRERGQVVPLVALVLLAGAVALVMVMRLGVAADRSARARTAADAAALAGAARTTTDDAGGACGAARRLAVANAARLEECTVWGTTIEVVVVVDGVAARARATATTDWVSD